ncbi:MAG: matrixin family metalloprotease [Chloroflexi bacterium]|nr:matrixin family metalloprotease [Chloroflexota bacterium]
MKRFLVAVAVAGLMLSLAAPVAMAKPGKPITPKVLEAVFIHYEEPAKGGRPAPTPTPVDNTYYQLLGPKWDLAKYPSGVPYIVNPSGGPAGAVAEVRAGLEAWDAATGVELFNDSPTIDSNSWWGKLDGKNNVSWQVIGDGRVIAGVWVWYQDNDGSGTMSAGDEVLETDMVFNTSVRWGIDPDGEGPTKIKVYDVRNIATHEGGHVVGLDDLYSDAYRDLTMYGYSSKGETRKISLEVGDISGTQALYDP